MSSQESWRWLLATSVAVLVCTGCGSDAPVGPGGTDAEPPLITTTALPNAVVGLQYAESLSASGGAAPYIWTVSSGALPAGMELGASTGEIGGTPTSAGESSFTVQITGSDGLSSTRVFSINVEPPLPPLEIITTSLPDVVAGDDYSVSLEATGGDGQYGWSVVGGTLPSGLALAGSTISGNPTGGGYFPLVVRATSRGLSVVAEFRIRVYETRAAHRFLQGVESYIAASRQYNQDLLPRNPHLATAIQAKVALLSDPDLEAKILNQSLFGEARTTKLDGSRIPIFIAFPADSMRAGALQDLSRLPVALSYLEGLLQVPWPRGQLQEWYGFRMGHSGGSGTLSMEDRGTYADRGVPHDAIIGHELGHTYIGHEGLTQFLEVYVYNLVETGSTEFSGWIWTRGEYVPFAADNTGFRALLDIYQLMGPQAMGRAYARIHSFGAPYGVPLSASARAVFAQEAPADVRAQVSALADQI